MCVVSQNTGMMMKVLMNNKICHGIQCECHSEAIVHRLEIYSSTQ